MSLESLWQEVEAIQKKLDSVVRKLETLEHPSEPTFTHSKPDPAPVTTTIERNLDRVEEVKSSPHEIDQQIGMKWLVVVGVTALVMATAFGVRIALVRGWIDEPTRCGLAALIGTTLFGLGARLRPQFTRYGEVLMSGGVVAVMIGIYAAHHLYHLIAAQVALPLLAFTAFSSAFLSWRAQAKSPIYIGMLGIYLAPFLVDTLGRSLPGFLTYLSLMNFSYLILAYSTRLLPLHILTLYLSTLLFTYGWYVTFRQPHDQWKLAFYFQIIQATAYGLASLLPALKRKQGLTQLETWLIFPVLLLFYYYAGDLLRSYAPDWHLIFGVSVGVVTLSLAELGRRALKALLKEHDASIMTISSAVLISLHLLHVHLENVLLSYGIVAWFYLLIALRRYFATSTFLGVLTFAGLLWTVARLFFMFGYPVNYLVSAFLNSQFLLIALVAMTLVLPRKENVSRDAEIDWLGYGGHFMMLYALTTEVGRTQAGSFKPFLVTLLWVLYAALVSVCGWFRRHPLMRNQALTIFAICTLKVFLFDTASSPMEVKAASYFALGVVLTIAGYFYQRRKRTLPH